MKCPACKSDLVEGESLRLQTTSEHVCCPNDEPSLKQSYRCGNQECETRKRGIIWNRDGERYGSDYPNLIAWIDGNDAPFGTWCRKANVEIYKKDENYYLGTIPCRPLKGWKVKVVYSYQSNEDGDILKRRAGLEWLRPLEHGMYAIHIWGIRMLQHSLSDIWRDWRAVKKNPKNALARIRIEEHLERSEWRDAKWWQRWSAGVAKIALKTI
jgi:hypothetical protein